MNGNGGCRPRPSTERNGAFRCRRRFFPPTLEPPRGACPGWKRSPELHALGRAILELRARRGLSQEQLGHAARLHRNYVGALERAEINTTFRVLLKLCAGLRIPLAELVDVYERQRGTLGPYQPYPGAVAAGFLESPSREAGHDDATCGARRQRRQSAGDALGAGGTRRLAEDLTDALA